MKFKITKDDIAAMQPIPDDIYEATLLDIKCLNDAGQPIKSKNGNEMVIWSFELTNAPRPMTLRLWTLTEEEFRGISFLPTLKVLGVGFDKAEEIDLNSLIGQECRVLVSTNGDYTSITRVLKKI